MNITGNLGLTIWDQLKDDFDFGQLENNWLAVDAHDHSSGKGVQISTSGIKPSAITNALLAVNSVSNAQLQTNSVSTQNLQNQSVTNTQLAPGSVKDNVIQTGGISLASLDPNIIQLGHIALWWRPPGSAAVPGGVWEIMDGRPWNTITNAWNLTSGNIPNLVGQFVQGSEPNGIGATGGSSTVNLAHSHNVNGHTHTVPSHIHTIFPDGNHYHLWMGGRSIYSRENAISPNVGFVLGYNNANIPVTYYSMYIKNLTSNPSFLNDIDGQTNMDSAGAHAHGGTTGPSDVLTSGSSTSGTDSQLGNISTLPPNTGLVYIMRCR